MSTSVVTVALVRSKPKFALGALVMTRGIDELCRKGFNPLPYLCRHARGDWGDLCESDIESNDDALEQGDRLLSSYNVQFPDVSKIWIITEYDRSVTTILLPEEY